MGGDHRIGGLHVVVLGHTGGAVRWLEGKEREGSVIGDSQRWYM